MDPLTALCLSVPLAAAAAYAAWRHEVVARFVAKKAHAAVTDAADRIANVLGESHLHGLTALSEAITAAASSEAESRVRAAKYQSRAIRTSPKPVQPGPIGIFDAWMAREGKELPQSVRDAVEWSIGRLRGVENDDQGSLEDARVYLTNYAPGVAKAVEDEMAAGQAKGS